MQSYFYCIKRRPGPPTGVRVVPSRPSSSLRAGRDRVRPPPAVSRAGLTAQNFSFQETKQLREGGTEDRGLSIEFLMPPWVRLGKLKSAGNTVGPDGRNKVLRAGTLLKAKRSLQRGERGNLREGATVDEVYTRKGSGSAHKHRTYLDVHGRYRKDIDKKKGPVCSRSKTIYPLGRPPGSSSDVFTNKRFSEWYPH